MWHNFDIYIYIYNVHVYLKLLYNGLYQISVLFRSQFSTPKRWVYLIFYREMEIEIKPTIRAGFTMTYVFRSKNGDLTSFTYGKLRSKNQTTGYPIFYGPSWGRLVLNHRMGTQRVFREIHLQIEHLHFTVVFAVFNLDGAKWKVKTNQNRDPLCFWGGRIQ